jgi:hypothetical protein
MNVIKPSKTKRQVESPSNLLEDILALMLWNDPRKRKKKTRSFADEFSSLEILLIRASEVSLLKTKHYSDEQLLSSVLHLSFSEKGEELIRVWLKQGKGQKKTHTLMGGSDTEGCLRKEAANSISSAASSSSSPGPISACSITSPILTTCVRACVLACLLAHPLSLFSLSRARALRAQSSSALLRVQE